MPLAIEEPTGTDTGEKKSRQDEIRRRLGKAVYAALSDYERERLGPHAEGIAQEWVDRTLRAMNGYGWRVHKSNPVCSVCREPLEQEGQPWRDYLASEGLQEYLTLDKENRAAEAIAHKERMEKNHV